MSREKLLIVEDEPIIINLAKRILEREGFEVILASDGYEALDILDKESVDLLLTDIRMPGMDGLELLKHYRERKPDDAAVIFTGHGTMETALEAMRIGANGFVLKPFTKNELVKTIESALETVRLMRENVRLKSANSTF